VVEWWIVNSISHLNSYPGHKLYLFWDGVDRMFKAPLYRHVMGPEFEAWAKNSLQAKWEITLGAESYIEFESEEDCAAYNLAWYEQVANHTVGYKVRATVDASVFYCPYVPLTTTGVIIDTTTMTEITQGPNSI